MANFFNIGFQYQGLLAGRDDDVLGLAFSYSSFSDSADSTYPQDYQNALELYYNAMINPWLNISPSLQYMANHGRIKTA